MSPFLSQKTPGWLSYVALGHLEFLSLLIQDELASRDDSMFAGRLKAAGFGVEKTFQEFRFGFGKYEWEES